MIHFSLRSLVFISAAAFGFSLPLGCSRPHEGDGDQLATAVDSFAASYFNWHFENALKNVDAGSQEWLVYAASNVHQADIDSLRAMSEGAAHELGDIDYTSDTTAVAFVTVRNFLAMDTIGASAHLVGEAKFALPLRYVGGKWLVSLRALPKAMKQHH